jgi:hypothetical protein
VRKLCVSSSSSSNQAISKFKMTNYLLKTLFFSRFFPSIFRITFLLASKTPTPTTTTTRSTTSSFYSRKYLTPSFIFSSSPLSLFLHKRTFVFVVVVVIFVTII